MKNLILSISCAFCLLAIAVSCKKNEVQQAPAKSLGLETRTIQQQKGTDCDKVDSLRTDCAIVDFTMPKVLPAGSATAKSVDVWADKFLVRLLTWTDYNEAGQESKTVEAAIERFFAIHDENKGSVASGLFNAICTHSALVNDGKYLTLMLDGHAFAGGNRGLNEVAIATFDTKTGKQLTWGDLVKDKAALLRLAETNILEMWAQDSFVFDKQEPLALPEAYGLTDKGLQLYYQVHEIYGLGAASDFTIPFSELGTNLKVAPPAAPVEESNTVAASDIYEAQGNDLVIPTFEIEVNNSAAVDKTLSKKKETIIVSAMFWAVPNDPKEKAKGEDGMISVQNKEIELSGNERVARFEGLTFPKNLLSKMEDPDIFLLINIYSGRKSSQNNLLNCGILDMKASQIGNKRFLLGCTLIDESITEETGTAGYPKACYALPEAPLAAGKQLSFLVECSEKGEMLFAGRPMKSDEDLMATLRPLLAEKIKEGVKPENLSDLETEGCMMGTSGAIRDAYNELKNELTGISKTAEKPSDLEKPVEKITTPKSETAAKPAPATKTTTKPAPAKSATTTTVTLKQNGDMLVNGKAVSNLESLRKVLQEALLKETVIPDKLDLTTVGETGMGMRAEMNTIIAEAIKGAKWIRKKGAIASLNTAVGKKLATPTQLEVGTYQTSGSFAYLSAKPKQADGKAIDYSKTSYNKDFAAGKFADNTVGLLQYEKGAWKIVTYSIGVNQPPVDVWVKNYKAPKALFGKTK